MHFKGQSDFWETFRLTCMLATQINMIKASMFVGDLIIFI